MDSGKKKSTAAAPVATTGNGNARKIPFVPRALSSIKPLTTTATVKPSPLPLPSSTGQSDAKAPSPRAQAILDAMFSPTSASSTFPGAVLYFSSIADSRRLPFDPLSRPKRVYRSSSSSRGTAAATQPVNDCAWLVEMLQGSRVSAEASRVGSAVRCSNSNADAEAEFVPIFPEAGVFDERAALEEALLKGRTGRTVAASKTAGSSGSSKSSIHSRLFKKSSTAPAPAAKSNSEDVDVFELISGEASVPATEQSSTGQTGGGLFGFSLDLPQLSRLKDSHQSAVSDDPYRSILTNDANDDDGKTTAPEPTIADDVFEYDAGDEDELITTQADDDDGGPANKKLALKKRRAKEEIEIRAVERIMKSKYNEAFHQD